MTEPRRSFRGPLVALAVLGAALALRTWVFGLLRVQTGSMEPTIRSGELVLWTPLGEPQVGDVVVVELPWEPGTLHVKRLVARGPARLELSEGRLYLDGERAGSTLGERFWIDGSCQRRRALFYEESHGEHGWAVQAAGQQDVTDLPVGAAWLLGDARRASEDSRQWGDIPVTAVRGRVLGVAWAGALCEGGPLGPRSLDAPVLLED